MNFINLTPHKIVINSQAIEPSGDIARVESFDQRTGTLGDIPIVARRFGKADGLPKQIGVLVPGANRNLEKPRVWVSTGISDGGYVGRVVYLVSSLVLAAVPDRHDVAAPDTGSTAVRDAEGRIIAVTRLIMNEVAFLEDEDCAF